jgi:hypothetical protein
VVCKQGFLQLVRDFLAIVPSVFVVLDLKYYYSYICGFLWMFGTIGLGVYSFKVWSMMTFKSFSLVMYVLKKAIVMIF